MPDLPQPGLTPTEETTPPRPHGHGSSGTPLQGVPHQPPARGSPSAFAGASARVGFKAPAAIFLAAVFSEKRPGDRVTPDAFLSPPGGQGKALGRGGGCGWDSGTSATARRAR